MTLGMTLSRRHTLAWMISAATILAPNRPAAAQNRPEITPKTTQSAPFSTLILPPLAGSGYGTDPDTLNPTAPWPLTLAQPHRALINVLGDLILPADDLSKGAGDLDIAAFFDEWISAPYPDQQLDRPKFLALLLWLDAQSRLLSGTDFAHTDAATQNRILDSLLTYDAPAEACDIFTWFRVLMIYGYYSLPQTLAAAGMEPEMPILGDYPGPTEDAMAHLNNLLISLDLPPYLKG